MLLMMLSHHYSPTDGQEPPLVCLGGSFNVVTWLQSNLLRVIVVIAPDSA